MLLSSYFLSCNWFLSYSMYFVLQFNSFSDGWLRFQLDDIPKGVATQIQIVASMFPEPQKTQYPSFALAFHKTKDILVLYKQNIIHSSFFMFMAPSQVDGCDMVNLDDTFKAVDKQMQTSQTHRKHRKNK